mgnify:CR=1 FL=1
MIFVALGTQKFQFNRLLQMIDQLLADGKIAEPVFAQIGNSDYEPRNFQYASFLDKNEFEKKIRECDVLITHSGVATIIAGLKNDKKVIVVPRLAKYGEHINDHQTQIIAKFNSLGYIIGLQDVEELAEALTKVKKFKPNKFVHDNSKMLNLVSKLIDK